MPVSARIRTLVKVGLLTIVFIVCVPRLILFIEPDYVNRHLQQYRYQEKKNIQSKELFAKESLSQNQTENKPNTTTKPLDKNLLNYGLKVIENDRHRRDKYSNIEDFDILKDQLSLNHHRLHQHHGKTCWNFDGLFTPTVLNETYDLDAIKRHPNLVDALLSRRNISTSIPSISKIYWNGFVFQESWQEQPKFLLYSAHFDSREASALVIRLITLYDGDIEQIPSLDLYCQIWSDLTQHPELSLASPVVMEPNNRIPGIRLKPYMISCKVSLQGKIPVAVSLVKDHCQTPTNILKIAGSPERKSSYEDKQRPIKVGICGPALFYYNEDFSTRLIEWIEIMKALGVSKVFMYESTCHENVLKVLRYYEKEGFVRLISFYYPTPYVQLGTFIRLWTKEIKLEGWSSQKIFLNDCLLRHKHEFDYLGIIDTDEVPILKKHNTLPEFLAYVRERIPVPTLRPSLFFKWKLFYVDLEPGHLASNISKTFYYLRHNKRTKFSVTLIRAEDNGKSFHDTNHILMTNIHKPSYLINFSSHPISHSMNTSLAYMGHFGDKSCKPLCNDENIEEDNTLQRYREKVIKGVTKTIHELFS